MTSRFIDHLLSGVLASRPAANAVPTGTLYCGTDTGLIYQTDGTSWSTWATLGASIPLTTKGDLLGYDTAAARLPVGTDSYVLTADSTQALGVKWAAPSGGGSSTRYACGPAAAAVTIPTGGAATVLTLPATDLVNEASWRSGANNYVTAPATGLYQVAFGAQENSGGGTSGIMDCSVFIGTTATLVAAIYHNTAYEIMNASGVISLTVGDQVSVKVRNNTAAAHQVILNHFSIKPF